MIDKAVTAPEELQMLAGIYKYLFAVYFSYKTTHSSRLANI